MIKKKRNQFFRKGFLAIAAIALLGGVVYAGAQFGNKPKVSADTPTGDVKSVIVQFKDVSAVTNAAGAERQQAKIADAEQKVASAIDFSTGFKQKTASYDNLPYAVYTVDAEGEASLKADPTVLSVKENAWFSPQTYRTIETIGGDTTTGYSDGDDDYTGAGYAIAVLDTGVESTHSLLSGKVIAEACFNMSGTYSNAVVESRCAGGASSATGAGSANDVCNSNWNGCGHGTGVSGTAAGKTTSITNGQDTHVISGAAKDASIVAINVFSKVTSVSLCGSSTPCLQALTANWLAGIDHVITLSNSNALNGKKIAAVNMSLGAAGSYSFNSQASCDAEPTMNAPINVSAASLKSLGIATVVAAGNDGATSGQQNKIASPACASNVVAVGATNLAGTQLASYSNNGPLTDLLAPGGDFGNDGLTMAAPGNTYVVGAGGTSNAAPHVSGAYAVLREKHPNATVDQLTTLLQASGVNVTDNRSGYTVGAKKRINVATALIQSPHPSIGSFEIAGGTMVINEGQALSLMGTVSDVTSCTVTNGSTTQNVTLNGNAFSASLPAASTLTLKCVNEYKDEATEVLNLNVNAAPSVPALSTQSYDKEAGTYTISWSESTDSDGVLEYRVFLNGQLMATLPEGTTTYTFQNILPDVAYTAEVRAVDTLGAISQGLTVTFGGANAGEDPLGVPNTGAMSLLQGNGLGAVILAAIAVIVLVGAVITSRQRANR